MKIKEGFMLRNVADNYIVVPVGKASLEFKGLINLNGVGAFIWECLEKETTMEEVIDKVVKEYNIDNELATRDVNNFINKLVEAKLLDI
ncbi:MAG: PqqD family protein [Bacilli bacterium]|jgi:hypothetical protein|nr:PqqD family protein [Bacilli bacterium]